MVLNIEERLENETIAATDPYAACVSAPTKDSGAGATQTRKGPVFIADRSVLRPTKHDQAPAVRSEPLPCVHPLQLPQPGPSSIVAVLATVHLQDSPRF